jgi:hypothetical protein
MGTLDMGWIRAPASRLESGCVEKGIIQCNETLAYPIFDRVEIARPELVGNETTAVSESQH